VYRRVLQNCRKLISYQSVALAALLLVLVPLAGCGRDYKHPEGIDIQRADDMDACWNEAQGYAQ
jgi:hypothetical protein